MAIRMAGFPTRYFNIQAKGNMAIWNLLVGTSPFKGIRNKVGNYTYFNATAPVSIHM